MVRSLYIVAYDIRDRKRLRRVFTTMRGYGNPLQYSVFICRLSEREKAMMKVTLFDILKKDEDRLMIIDLGKSENSAGRRIEFIGTSPIEESEEIMVI